ncbi:MAG: DUF5666 domain-containing protein, partial [Gammaproteobacteria bacterium]|nr:DUF5666 domain-containing protein [Gammaproteobacteria bacterium]
MNTRKLILTSAIIGIITGLTACNSNNNTSSSSRYVSGPITAFGSVYVNGNRYNTDHATVYIEDSPGSESELRVGMMVNVETSGDNSATTIHFDDDLEGFVTSTAITIDNTGTLVVMGQNVTITSHTVFESKVTGITSASAISAGNIVEVSGYSSGEGQITATRLEVKADNLATYLLTHPEGVELKGIVKNYNSAGQSFLIGSQPIEYSSAVLDDMPQGNWDGLYVEVKSTQTPDTGTLIASKVELEDDGDKGHADDEDEIEVHGAISDISDSNITVNGHNFLINASIEIEHGSRQDLVIDAIVEVEGYMNSNGQLVAHEIEFVDNENDSSIEFYGTVIAIETSDTNVGQITLTGGQVIMINNNTIMHDSQDESGMIPDTHFNLSDLGTGEFVEVYDCIV